VWHLVSVERDNIFSRQRKFKKREIAETSMSDTESAKVGSNPNTTVWRPLRKLNSGHHWASSAKNPLADQLTLRLA
jgi:hypothetical protein